MALRRRRQLAARRLRARRAQVALALAHAGGGVGGAHWHAPSARELVQGRRGRRLAEQQVVRRATVLDGALAQLLEARHAARRVVTARAAAELDDAVVEVGHVGELEPAVRAHAQHLRVQRQEALDGREERAQRRLEDHLRRQVGEVDEAVRERGVAQQEVGAARLVEELLDVGAVEPSHRGLREVDHLEAATAPHHDVAGRDQMGHPWLHVLDAEGHGARQQPPERLARHARHELAAGVPYLAQEAERVREGVDREGVVPVRGEAWDRRRRRRLRKQRHLARGDGARPGRIRDELERGVGGLACQGEHRGVDVAEARRLEHAEPAEELSRHVGRSLAAARLQRGHLGLDRGAQLGDVRRGGVPNLVDRHGSARRRWRRRGGGRQHARRVHGARLGLRLAQKRRGAREALDARRHE